MTAPRFQVCYLVPAKDGHEERWDGVPDFDSPDKLFVKACAKERAEARPDRTYGIREVRYGDVEIVGGGE